MIFYPKIYNSKECLNTINEEKHPIFKGVNIMNKENCNAHRKHLAL